MLSFSARSLSNPASSFYRNANTTTPTAHRPPPRSTPFGIKGFSTATTTTSLASIAGASTRNDFDTLRIFGGQLYWFTAAGGPVSANDATAPFAMVSALYRAPLADMGPGGVGATGTPIINGTGTIYWAGIGRVVYAMSEHKLKGIIGPHPDNLTLDLPCRTVFAAGQRAVEVIGPLAEDDPAFVGVHDGAWDHT